MRAVLNREIVVRLRVDDESGTLTDADAVPTVAVTDGDGAAVAGVSAVSNESTGLYVATIDARTEYDRLSVVWTATVGAADRTVSDYVDVVAERLVPFWRLKEDSELADASVHTLQRVADAVEEWFRDALRFPPVVEAWRGRFRVPFDAPRLHVPDVFRPVSLIALSRNLGSDVVNYTAAELADVFPVDSAFERGGSNMSFLTGAPAARGTFPAGTYTAWLTNGEEHPPEDLRRAAATFARYVARTSNYPERARRVITQDTEIDLAMPSPDRPTGLPEVDAVISRYRVPVVA